MKKAFLGLLAIFFTSNAFAEEPRCYRGKDGRKTYFAKITVQEEADFAHLPFGERPDVLVSQIELRMKAGKKTFSALGIGCGCDGKAIPPGTQDFGQEDDGGHVFVTGMNSKKIFISGQEGYPMVLFEEGRDRYDEGFNDELSTRRFPLKAVALRQVECP